MNSRKNHKWDRPNKGRKATGNKGGLVASCLRCGCVREYVAGRVTYFLNENIYFKSPNCESLIVIP